jgi:hypothetical protein
VHCFSRLTETENVFENKVVCLKIAELLISYGANVNQQAMGRSLLQNFCAISMDLEPMMAELSLDVVSFLLMRGANP